MCIGQTGHSSGRFWAQTRLRVSRSSRTFKGSIYYRVTERARDLLAVVCSSCVQRQLFIRLKCQIPALAKRNPLYDSSMREKTVLTTLILESSTQTVSHPALEGNDGFDSDGLETGLV
jgi:hypothetical protein